MIDSRLIGPLAPVGSRAFLSHPARERLRALNTLSVLFDGVSLRVIIFPVEQAFSAILNLHAVQKVTHELILAVAIMLVAGSAEKSRKLMLTHVEVGQG